MIPNLDSYLDPDQWDAEPEPVNRGVTVKVCIECGGIATHALNGTRYCFDHYREQSAVLMGEMAALKADERRDDR